MINSNPAFEQIGRLLRRHRGIDLSKYRSRCIARRLSVRVRALRLDGLEEYASYLERHREEYDPLLRALTINVTAFLRDRRVFDLLEREVIPRLIQVCAARGGGPMRIWSAGCSTGEEAYSLALLIHKVAGRWGAGRVIGTDIDPEAIARATQGCYDRTSLETLPEEMRERYFEPASPDTSRPIRELARSCRFQVADLFAPARPPRLARADLVACRNVMIYLSNERQHELLEMFAETLRPQAFLVLGPVERVTGPAERWFEPFDLIARIFRKVRAEAH
jgi:chemotaxis methyl-accepting protein methylase